MASPFDWQGFSDEELAAHGRQGSKKAFGELVRRHQRAVVTIAYRLSGDAMLAQDVAQECFVKAWQRLGRFRDRGAGSFRAWLYRLAHNATIDQLRKTRPSISLDWQPLAHDPSPQDVVLQDERTHRVQQAILALPEACRAALILREYEGMSYREISQILDIPIGTVMSRLNYARGKLRQMLVVDMTLEGGGE